VKSKNYIVLFAGAVLLIALLAVINPARAGWLAQPQRQSGAPQVVSYQGQVAVDGLAYTGTGHFKFSVVDQAGTTSYWSNDGTAPGGSEPTTAISLMVTNGLFNVLLGDITLDNMIALPASAFNGTERYLRVWFSSDNTDFTLLSPDRRIAAVPYALQAEEAIYAVNASDADTLDGQPAGSFWQVGGNSGTDPAVNYLGTSDMVSLVLGTNDTGVAYLSPDGNVGIGTATIDGSAALEISATDRGFLLPRLTESQIADIENPANGLQVYNLTNGRIYVFVGPDNLWRELAYGPGVIFSIEPWQYVREITIDNTGNTADLTDYQILVTLDTATLIAAGKMNADGSDIRFTNVYPNWYSYWIEGGIQNEYGMNQPDTKIWVKVPFIPASSTITIYLIYGNPAASPMSDIQDTFIFGDDFNDNLLDTSLWTTSGNVQEQNQRLEHLAPLGGNSSLDSTQYFTGSYVIEMLFKKGGYVYRGAGSVDAAGTNAARLYIQDCCAVIFQVGVANVWDSREVEPGFWSRSYNPEYYLQIIRHANGTFTINSSVPAFEPGGPKAWSQVFTNPMPSDTPLRISAFESVWSSAWWLWDRYEDDIRVREYTDPEPAITVSVEQSMLAWLGDK